MNNNCVLYLVDSRESDVVDFINSVRALEVYFLENNPADVICFYEAPLGPSLGAIQSYLRTPINFQYIEFSIPEHNKHLSIPDVYYVEPNNPFPIGYRHMCRFFAGEIFKQKVLDNYEYFMRMDSDSFLLRPVQYNIFDLMKNQNKKYGYLEGSFDYDHPNAAEGLWAKALEWYEQNKDLCFKKPFDDIPEYMIFNTNFEICNIEYFRNSKYMDFYNYVDSLGGIYTKRWGDHIIKMLGVGMLFDDKLRHSINDFGYKHGSLIIP